VKALLPRIPPVERDVIELYFVLGKKQEVIARMLSLSQQAVSHRLHAAYRRLVFMLHQPEVDQQQMRRDLEALLPNAFTVAVLCDFAQTSSQTVTAKRLKVPQQRICWHLNAGLKALRDSIDLDAAFYTQYFTQLRQNRNILREVLAGRRKKVESAEETQYAHYSRGPAYGYAAHYAYAPSTGAELVSAGAA
jgi:DNA-directed RNA polymerase specialized sigma24 family protein